MLPTQLQDALQQLKGFRLVAGAEEDFVYLCAHFCDRLSEFRAYPLLRRRAEAYEALAGPGSTLDDTRDELCRLSGRAERSSPEPDKEMTAYCGITGHLTLDDIRQHYGKGFVEPAAKPVSAGETPDRPLLPTQAKNISVLIRWFCAGEQTIHDPEWVKWNLFTAFAITECAVESGWEFIPLEFNAALVRFRDQLWAAWRRSDQEHLFGSCLLVRSQNAVNAGATECRRLIKSLCELDVQARAVVRAAEDLYRLSLPEREQAGESPEIPSIEEMSEVKVSSEVTISAGESCFVLRCEGLGPLVLTPEESSLFTRFAHRAAIGAATEVIPWEVINAVVGKSGPEAAAKQDPLVAKYLSMFNSRLKKWALPSDGKDWVGTVKGDKGGRRLNTSVDWQVDTEQPLIRELMRKTHSISGPLLSPQKAARHTPGRDSKLPARPRRDKVDHDEDDGE